jgi:hypothetical protein
MTYDELLHYIQSEMSMQHIYQPVVIEALLDANGSATLRQLALALLAADEGALATAEARLRKMPLEVLVDGHVIPQGWRHAMPHGVRVQRLLRGGLLGLV